MLSTKRTTFRCAKPKGAKLRRGRTNCRRCRSKLSVDAQTQNSDDNDNNIVEVEVGKRKSTDDEDFSCKDDNVVVVVAAAAAADNENDGDNRKPNLLAKNELPRFLYAKKGRGSNDTFAGLSGKVKPVVVYATRCKSSEYRFRLTLNWKSDSKVLDETRREKHVTFAKAAKDYDGLVRMIGVKKNREVWRIFNIYLIMSVLDTRTKQELLDGVSNHYLNDGEDVANENEVRHRPEAATVRYGLDIDALSYSEQLAHELYHHFGRDHYDWTLDYIDVAAVSRRNQAEDARDLVSKMSRTFHECTLIKPSGCWLSPSLTTYRTVARWKYDGFSSKSLFSHDGENYERHVVRHHPTRCELFIEKNHCRCCRPSHLCYGSAMANTSDMQLRQAVAQLLLLFSDSDSLNTLLATVDVFSKLVQRIQSKKDVVG